ncbi:PAPA-1-like conserved region-domain-containing protein [Pyronema omphalodes]|nr:PAPA-1-like conserved region-domain-containing protein [Pyronema omphalodes]
MTPQLRSPVKRRRPDYNDDGMSDSELSDIDDIEETTPPEPEEEDDDDEEDEISSDEDTPEGEVEESYLSEDAPGESDDGSDSDLKPLAKPIPSRGSGTRGRAIAKPAPKKPAAAAAPKATKISTSKAITAKTTAKNKQPTIKLKIGKDKLRQATSTWTPPPAAGTDTRELLSASATPHSVPVSKTTMPRGRKVVQEDSEEDEDEDQEEEEDDEEDAEGEIDEEDELGDEDAEGETDDELMDSDDDTGITPGTDFLSRTGTPDMSRLTNRQRTKLGDITTADLLELPSGYETKGSSLKAVSLSVQEQELKRAEMARRRKNLTDQKLEEEKIDTINRLLKKQTPKMRGRGRATGDATPADGNGDITMGGMEAPPPPPTMMRWVSNKDGVRLAIPESWMSAPVGRVFEKQEPTERMRNAGAKRRLVEEL